MRIPDGWSHGREDSVTLPASVQCGSRPDGRRSKPCLRGTRGVQADPERKVHRQVEGTAIRFRIGRDVHEGYDDRTIFGPIGPRKMEAKKGEADPLCSSSHFDSGHCPLHAGSPGFSRFSRGDRLKPGLHTCQNENCCTLCGCAGCGKSYTAWEVPGDLAMTTRISLRSNKRKSFAKKHQSS